MQNAATGSQSADLRGWLGGLVVIALIVAVMMAFWFIYHP